MSDTIIAQLRTVIPGVIGAIFAWAASRGVDLDPATRDAAVITATGVAIAIWRALIGVAEKHLPQMGWLLGYPSKPQYDKTVGGIEHP